jgi:hypothetical protein
MQAVRLAKHSPPLPELNKVHFREFSHAALERDACQNTVLPVSYKDGWKLS